MAPKNKFSREEMVSAAVVVVRKKGLEGLTAKALAEDLGTSTQPIFTCFGSMDTVRSEVYAAAEKKYEAYAMEGLKEKIPFYGLGMQYIRFAKDEPALYRLLFLQQAAGEDNGPLSAMEHLQTIARPSLEKIYHMTPAEADRYFRDLWLVVHSLATLIVTGDCPYGEEEIGQILTGFSVSLCKAIKEIPGFTTNTFDKNRIFQTLIEEKQS